MQNSTFHAGGQIAGQILKICAKVNSSLRQNIEVVVSECSGFEKAFFLSHILGRAL